MASKILYWLLLLAIITTSCATNNLMNYYFPIRNDAELRVYKFDDQNDEENKEYWLIESDPKARTLVLNKNNSDHQLHSAYFVQVNTESVNLIEYSHYKIRENMSNKLRTRSIN